MRLKHLSSLIFVTAGVAAIGAALPVLGQQGPESLLPPGFGDPPPPPPPATKAPQPKQGTPTPSSPTGENPATSGAANALSSSDSDDDGEDEESEEIEIRYDVPPTARRSLKQVGIMSEAGGGFAANAYGAVPGRFLINVAQKTKGPLASRWGTIMTRRLLASRTNTPGDVNGADWVAERGALILRMGDAVVARQLIQQVDASSYSPRLLQVAMPIFLANGDLAGMCPLAEGGARTESNEWKTALSICASLAGEQARATSLLGQVRNKGWVKGIDYRLAEKAVGAGTNGRSTVKIEWDGVTSLTNWRHGMAQATGIEPPEGLYASMGRQVDGWRAQLPMISSKTRVSTATGAAAMGVLSNRTMVDTYGLAAEDPDVADDISTKADYVRTAFVGGSDGEKISAMQSLWDGAANERDRHGMLVLTARAAALIAPIEGNAGDADRLVASMLTGGFDTQAARWISIVDESSLAWALLAAGSPEWANMVDAGAISDFQGNDDSEAYQKTALLVAGLGGLGRVSAATIASVADDIEINVTKETAWSRAIRSAAERGESGTVALLAAAGLQASDWTKVPPHHLYHMVAALRTVGLDAEARMIAAEAVSFG
jgi:hypothetical protein